MNKLEVKISKGFIETRRVIQIIIVQRLLVVNISPLLPSQGNSVINVQTAFITLVILKFVKS